MRVLITAQQLRRAVPGGIGTYVRGLFAGLDTCDVRPTAWASRGPADTLGLGRGADIRTSFLPGSLLSRAWDAGLAPAGHDLDRVHATSLSVPGRRGAGPPVSCFVHDLAWRRFPGAYPRRGRRWHDASLARAIDRCDVLMVPSTQSADDLMAAGAPSRRVHIVAEGCDHLPVERRHGDGGCYLLSVSTLEPRKNLRRLVEAYQLARPRMSSPWPLRIVGPAGWGERLGDLASVEGVELLGRVEDAELARLLAGARALAYVPLFEGFGLPVMEAMRAGVPVATSDSVPAAAPGTAATADPHSHDEIASALIAVLEDDGLRAQLIQAGISHAQGHTWQTCAAHHVNLWEPQR